MQEAQRHMSQHVSSRKAIIVCSGGRGMTVQAA